jgi:NADH-quinone oxidoreductase subunit N
VIATDSSTSASSAAWRRRTPRVRLAYQLWAPQAGYIAVGLAAFNADGSAAALFYGLLDVLMNAAAFLVVARVGADGSNPSHDELRGLHRRSPLLAISHMLAVFALAGVPPTAGFIGKWFLFRAAMQEGLWWLVLLGVWPTPVSDPAVRAVAGLP